MLKLPSRQVHLDFHTSEHLPSVGAQFNKSNWQKALRLGRVNSVTVFAKCHHSWSYYPTKVGLVHPALKRDLLGEQIAACHEIGVRAPIYYTVGWSAYDAERHPEWLNRNKDGLPSGNYDVKAKDEEPKPAFQWKLLCPNESYTAHIVAQTREICEKYEVDGFFYDICFFQPCWCKSCKKGMKAEGLDVDDDKHVQQYHILRWQRFTAATSEVITAIHPGATVFYNGGADPYNPQWLDRQTHFEMEDLPTSWGGYNTFPMRSKAMERFGKQRLAMSGKFHSNWGEFGGFKHPDAIRFEASCMISYGARCSFGDQLHPTGIMDLETYRTIGHAYRYVQQIEQYGLDGEPFANLAIWQGGDRNENQGIANMLMESQLDFEVVAEESDLSRYAALILPSGAVLEEAAAGKISEYVGKGGSLLIVGGGALDKRKERFVIDVGAEYVGTARFAQDYVAVGKKLAKELVQSPLLCYSPAIRVKVTDGEVLAAVKEPFFDRTYGRYCGHQNTPNELGDAAHPAAWRKGRIVCLAHPMGDIYYHNGARMHRQYFINALRLIYRNAVVTTELPSAGRVNVIHQASENRYVVHMMYGPPLQRGKYQVIEDLPKLFNVPVSLKVPQKIRKAYLVPQELPLRITRAAGKITVKIPQFSSHQAVVFQY